MRIAHLKQLQASQDVAAMLATDYLTTGDPHFSDRYVERVAAVTAAQIQDVANRYLDRGKLITTALLPREAIGAEGLPKAEDLLRQQAEYGANSAAVREPSEPSRNAFSAPVLSHGSVEPHSLRSASSFASGIVKSSHSVMRAVNFPSLRSC